MPSNAQSSWGPLLVPVATGALCAGDVAFANGQVAPIVVKRRRVALALLVWLPRLP